MAKSDENMSSKSSNSDPNDTKSKQKEAKTDINTESLCVIPSPQTLISTNVSLLIESLVKNICMIYEADANKAAAMYNLICDKLFKMHMIDESYTMNEFEGVRSQYQRAFLHLLTSALGKDKTLPLRPIWPSLDSSNSHYLREFDEIEYIAGGGFGRVYRVRHKLDGVEYAVKKIIIRSEGIDSVRNYLSEVKTFSSINHTNIVQYKAAWLELGAPTVNKAIMDIPDNDSSSSSDLLDIQHVDSKYIYHNSDQHSFSDCKNEDTDFEISFENSISNTRNKTDRITTKKQRKESLSEGDQVVCTLDMKEIKRIRATQRQTQVKWATLYIQMSLCQSTLKQWLEKRNEMEIPLNGAQINGQIFRNSTVFEILAQLLKGLEYIHSKGIVHHDIKPSNIFIQMENGNILVQLGDFGLACPLQSVRHSLAFGTKLYAAPEQLNGKCDPKSDIYSVGIVLFELIENFHTDMERVQYINQLRKGHLSAKIQLEQPQVAKIIMQLVARDSEQRPDASSLLKSIEMKTNESQQIEQLKIQLAEKDEEIMHLKELLKSHGIKSV